jgi:hypothetical protein
MRTPAGNECPYFYGDYFRGRNIEECRLLGSNPNNGPWKADLCKTCPVPGITRSNACENMTLYASVKKGALKNRRVKVTAYCSKSNSEVKVPQVGCELCHQDFNLLDKPESK